MRESFLTMKTAGSRQDRSANPDIIFWEIAPSCAQACQGCRANAIENPELDYFESLQLLDEIASLRPRKLVLTGGVPTMRKDLIDLIRYATEEHGIHTSLRPSAAPLLTGSDYDALKAAGVERLSLNLNGATSKSHDGFQGVGGTFFQTLAAMDRSYEAGLPVLINTTIHRGNIDELDAIAELMYGLLPAAWSISLIVPTGRVGFDELPEAEDVETMLMRIYAIARGAPFDIKIADADHHRRVVVQLERGTSRVRRRSSPDLCDGRGVVFVSHSGDITPGASLSMPVGNVRKDSLVDVYREHPMFVGLRDLDRLKGKCGRCEFRGLCGGSRSRAFSVYGDIFAEDPLCAYQPDGSSDPGCEDLES